MTDAGLIIAFISYKFALYYHLKFYKESRIFFDRLFKIS